MGVKMKNRLEVPLEVRIENALELLKRQRDICADVLEYSNEYIFTTSMVDKSLAQIEKILKGE